MGISKKLRKQRKKNFMLLLFSTAVITSILAVMKLTGITNPIDYKQSMNQVAVRQKTLVIKL